MSPGFVDCRYKGRGMYSTVMSGRMKPANLFLLWPLTPPGTMLHYHYGGAWMRRNFKIEANQTVLPEELCA
jgi:hypothetical protein